MFLVYLAAFSLLAGAAATNQSFTSSGEMDFTMCPITYFGQRYEKAYVSFSSNRFAVCFKGSYIPGISNDCILMSGGTADRGELMVLVKEIPTGSGVHQLLPNLQHPGKCVNVIPLKDSQLSEIHQVELANFDMQSLVAIRTFSGYTNVSLVADALVNGRIVSNHIFQTNETNKGVITDVSGCRFAGLVYQTNTTVYEPSICSMVTCEASGVATAVSNCGSMERCQGNGSCALNAVCSVAGSMIIDFMGGHQSVPDRCGYTLLRSPALPGVQVVGVFKERRRKSVSFLDRVILQLEGEGVEISLEQGNRVQLDDTLLTLNATAQLVHGMELSKDLNGVTAKIMDSNYNISVSFDGFTAIIHMAGPIGAAMHGLCADSSAILSQERVSQHSATDCETQYEDANGTTDCNTTAEWCNLLREAPFTTCNSHVDPKPFIDGCTQQLCKYPSEDNVKCQFLDAYAQTCRQYSDVTVDGWRSQTGCSAVPPAICRDKFCSDHEFCGVDSITGATRCLCRAIFASKYKPTNSFGEPIVCEKKSASVTLANCLLNDEGIDYSILTLNDPTCRGEMDNLTHMVKFSFNSENTCGTVIMANSTHINYKNTIMTQNTSDEIIRHDKLHMDFSCYYTQPDIKSFALKLRHSSVIQQISSGEWKYNLTMEAYTNPDRIKPVDSNTNIALNEKLWVDIMADGLDETILTIVTDSCWATSQPSPTATLRYYVIIDGCPNLDDGTVKVEGNGMGLSNRFSFNAFQFSGRDSEVYLHCKVELCLKQENCIKSCSQARRRRRSASTTYLDKNTAFITMAWTY